MGNIAHCKEIDMKAFITGVQPDDSDNRLHPLITYYDSSGVYEMNRNVDVNVPSITTPQDLYDAFIAAIIADAATLSYTITEKDVTWAGWSAPRAQSTASRSLNSGYQISTERDSFVSYSVDVSCTLSLVTGQSGTVYLEIADNSGFSVNLQEVARFVNANSGTLTLGLNLTQAVTGTLSGFVPAGKYVRLRTANNVGTPMFNYRSGQEVLV